MKMIAHKNTTVVNKKFVAIGFLLWLVSAVAYVLYTVPFYSEEERQRIRAVGVAVEKYEAILDAEWTDENCTLEHCPNSSKSLPGHAAGPGAVYHARAHQHGASWPLCASPAGDHHEHFSGNRTRRRDGRGAHPNYRHQMLQPCRR